MGVSDIKHLLFQCPELSSQRMLLTGSPGRERRAEIRKEARMRCGKNNTWKGTEPEEIQYPTQQINDLSTFFDTYNQNAARAFILSAFFGGSTNESFPSSDEGDLEEIVQPP